MWRSLSISKKIYIGLGILLTGYFVSMLFGFVKAVDTEKRLRSVHAYLSPAAHQSQAALAAFKGQIKAFEDIFLTGDETLVEEADRESAILLQSLQDISRLALQYEGENGDIDNLIKKVTVFSDSARRTYLAFIVKTDGDQAAGNGGQNQMSTLAEETRILEKRLQELQTGYSDRLKKDLSGIIVYSQRQRYLNLLAFCLIAAISTVFVSLILRRSVILPLRSAADMVKSIAKGKGDLTRRLAIRNEDEVGDLSRWFNTFVENMQEMTRSIITDVGTLKDASTALSGMSDVMSGTSDKMVGKTNSVSAAMEQMDAGMRTIAVSMEEATSSTDQVAGFAEEMTATINEIAMSSHNAAEVTRKAVEKSHQASQRVGELGAAADEIGKVTEMINEISEQTNLLALNATIEAARAGEAGKGFAVVADEIKVLARQTAEATLDIKERISGIQATTSWTVRDIKEIGDIIDKVNETVTIIASSVEQQSASTKEIAINVSEISKAIGDVNDSVSQSSNFTTQVAEDLAGVTQSAIDVSENSSRLKENAAGLSRLADQLHRLVGQFKV
ncbi:MAG: methyl-accepting chemotaxis protein [Thermodesulfobacteriota bacterium]